MTGLAALIAGCTLLQAHRSHDSALSRNLTTFNAIVKELELNYVDSIRTDDAFNAAIAAMLSTIDPYTEFYSPENKEALLRMTTGEYAGIGSYIMERDGNVYISQPMQNSPAAKAGLRPGDLIMRVDTVNTLGMKSDQVSNLLRGQGGTTVEVTVKRPFVTDSIQSFTIERDKVSQPSVPYFGLIGGNTGYIRLTSFIDKTPAEIKEALESFKAVPNLNGIILDLRGNGGGLLESAVETVGYFVPKGTEVVRTKGKTAESEKIYKTTRNPIFPDIPLAVLVDGGSASASEITAGAIQDLDRGVLIGSRSFGKGLVQNTRSLPYESILKVTTAKYYIPSGRLIQALDYSHRNPDGTVARTPDSLTNVYKTLHGREVRDGGGLIPDEKIEWESPSRIVYNIVRDNWAFDFANKFAAQNKEIAPATEFVITDEIYDDFKKSIDPEKFKYDKVCEEMMKELSKTAEVEGYMNDETKEEIEKLSKLLTHNLDKDLDTHRKQIEEYIGSEIIGRYYYEPGQAAFEIRNDKAVDKAIELFNNPAEYKKTLSPETSVKSKTGK